jgi:hypothetical protein
MIRTPDNGFVYGPYGALGFWQRSYATFPEKGRATWLRWFLKMFA